MLDWMNQNAAAISGIAAAVVALFTVVLAVVTRSYAKTTQVMAKQNLTLIAANVNDLYLRTAPILALDREPTGEFGHRDADNHLTAYWRNIGYGPAMNAAFGVLIDNGGTSEFPGRFTVIRPDESVKIGDLWISSEMAESIDRDGSKATFFVDYEDFFGSRYLVRHNFDGRLTIEVDRTESNPLASPDHPHYPIDDRDPWRGKLWINRPPGSNRFVSIDELRRRAGVDEAE